MSGNILSQQQSLVLPWDAVGALLSDKCLDPPCLGRGQRTGEIQQQSHADGRHYTPHHQASSAHVNHRGAMAHVLQHLVLAALTALQDAHLATVVGQVL